MEGGQPIFDEIFYNELVQCLNQLDSRMLQSAGAQWDGMIAYANAGGSLQNNDTWSSCDETLRYMEYNCTVQEYGSMPIFEVITQPLLHTLFIALYFHFLAL